MRPALWLTLSVALFAPSPLGAASKDNERPGKEMLQMMEFLREMEMIKQMEMMRDMHNLESIGDPVKGSNAPMSSPTRKKEAAK